MQVFSKSLYPVGTHPCRQSSTQLSSAIQDSCRRLQARPNDDGELVPINIEQVIVLPNVGDYVHIGATKENLGAVRGKVASRLFTYQQISSGEVYCGVNIVLDECDDDVRATLIKE